MRGDGNLRNLQQLTAHYNAGIARLKPHAHLLLLSLLLAAACGSPPEPQAASGPSSPTAGGTPRPSATGAVTAAAPTGAPTGVPTGAPTLIPVPAAAATTVVVSVPPPPDAAPAAGPQYKGIPVSRTQDGFYALGAPEAPVTITDYSDFL